MDTDKPLRIVSETLVQVPSCTVITVAPNGDADARVVNPKPLSDSQAVINDDVATRQANRKPESYRWHPGGQTDPNVVYIDFTTERIEMRNSAQAVVPDPKIGLRAAVPVREAAGRRLQTTLPW